MSSEPSEISPIGKHKVHSIEFTHFSSGNREVTAPPPFTDNAGPGEFYTFRLPMDEATQRIKAVVARRLAQIIKDQPV